MYLISGKPAYNGNYHAKSSQVEIYHGMWPFVGGSLAKTLVIMYSYEVTWELNAEGWKFILKVEVRHT